MTMSKKKKVTIRITKLHHGYYVIHERTRFLMLFPLWVKGSPTLRLPKAFAKFNIARNAVWERARQLDVVANIVIGEAVKKK